MNKEPKGWNGIIAGMIGIMFISFPIGFICSIFSKVLTIICWLVIPIIAFIYLDNVEEDIINLAISTNGSKGQIIAIKSLCEYIIVKKKISELYRFMTKKQVDDVHNIKPVIYKNKF